MKQQMIKLLIAIIAIAYIVFPIDLLPDIIPVVGWIDDIGVGLFAIWYWIKR